jgi:DNA topoisomerase-1
MSKTLVVVESPAKAKTIKKYLGSKYEVMASKGHVKDLPKKLGIDIEKGFLETYEVVPGKEKVLAELKSAAQGSEQVLLATDPDREGEAIAWHLADELKGARKKTKRVEFHEITKKGVEYGVTHPRELDSHLVDAQRARRVLDRIVGYDVSALVWSKLAFGLSAGRVQSVALRLIVDREREIEAFVPEEYWNCGAALSLTNGVDHPFMARLASRDGEKLAVKKGDEAAAVRAHLETAKYRIAKVTKSERKRNPPTPYTTSKLQQDAVNRLGFGAKRAMQIAQGLYEGVDLGKDDGGQVGLITYMRTDSTRLSPDAVDAARAHVADKYGKAYVPAVPNVFKSKKNTQDAHEAIRPTSLELTPESVRKHLKDDQFKLYKMIWERFLASQMTPAVYDQTGVDIEAVAADKTAYGLRASGRTLKFSGWLEAYGKGEIPKAAAPLAGEGESETGGDGNAKKETRDLLADDAEASLPELSEGQALHLVTPPGVVTEQKFTQGPPRYSEASLVRELEERGIGRPSTYAEIISKVQARDYVEKLDGARFRPTLLGKFIVDGLVRSELDFMDPAFTSKMEEELDEVEAGKEKRIDLLKRFYKRFRSQLDSSKKLKRWNPEPEPTDQKCDMDGGVMLKRWSKHGWFLGCANYPECKNTRDLGRDGKPTVHRETGIDCDKCGKPMVIRTSRYGEYLRCSGYPECDSKRPVPLGVKCPKCGGDLIEIRPKKRGGKSFYGCSNYQSEAIKCDFKLWQKPITEPCPSCGAPFLVMGGSRTRPMIACANKECGYKRAVADPEESTAVVPVVGGEQPAAAP